MRHYYINSHLSSCSVSAEEAMPDDWIFTGGDCWLLLTPRRLERLAARLGLLDQRVDRLAFSVRRDSPWAAEFSRRLGLPIPDLSVDEAGCYPLAICPVCDSVHHPHPLEAELACVACRAREEKRRSNVPGPGIMEDRRLDGAAREYIRENDPGSFRDGVLWPNWRLNEARRLDRDWDLAVNRILMGKTYRAVAREFDCSVGLVHQKVKERCTWEDN